MNLKYDFAEVTFAQRPIVTAVVFDQDYKFHQAACHFLLEVAKNSKSGSKATVKSRASDLTRYLNLIANKAYDFYDIDYRKITEQQMCTYLMDLQNNQLADSSIARHISTISEFYIFAHKFGYIEDKKQFSYSAQEKSGRLQLSHKASSQIVSQYISEDDFKNILAHITTKNSYKRARDELALKFGYHLGVRAHELVSYGNFDIKNLKKQFPDNKTGFFEQGFIRVTGKGFKTRSVPICLPLKRALWKFLYGEWSKHVGKSLFEKKKGEPLVDTDYAGNVFKAACNAYICNNIVQSKIRETYNRWVFHSLRHTCATNFVTFCDNTKSDPYLDLPQWMGHSQKETTNLYICAEALLNRRLEILKQLENESFIT